MLDWHSCQICYPLEIKILLLLLLLWHISYSSKDTQLAEHPLYNTILAFLAKKRLVFSILFDEKYFV